MSLSKTLGVGVVLCSVVQTGTADAHRPNWFRRPVGMFNQCCAPRHDPCCAPIDPCGVPSLPAVPANPCGCGPVMQPLYQTQMRPVAQTTLVPQQVVTYQNVPQVQYQRQAYVENVPVTVMQQQVRYRDVAVQVNQQVAQVQTQLVPRQTLSYVPETRQVGMQYLGMQTAAYPIYGALPAVPTTAGLPIYGQATEPVPDPVSATIQPSPYMQGASSNGDWSTIQQRGTIGGQSSAAPPPSAATVWQSQLHSGAVAR
ncbi:MAG: hypothetical protein KDA75_10375 [Planctomycetaceae bacterium]|nr:hypothetical protein [Planctomycetaceae bacterium]